jgi:hypothetical protein
LTHDPAEIAKIALAALATSSVLALVAGFYEGAAAGKKALWLSLPLTGMFGALQVVPSFLAPWVVLGCAALALVIALKLRAKP